MHGDRVLYREVRLSGIKFCNVICIVYTFFSAIKLLQVAPVVLVQQ